MTSPNVGKVTLDAAINAGDLNRELKSQLTKAIADEVLPQIREMQAEMASVNDEINKVNAKPFEEIRKGLSLIEDEYDKVAKAQLAERKATEKREALEEKLAENRRQRSNAQARIRRLEKKDDEDSQDRLAEEIKLRDKLTTAIKDQSRQVEEALEAERLASNRTAREREADQKRISAAVQKARDEEIDGLNDLVKNVLGGYDELIQGKIRETDAEIREAKRSLAEHERIERRKTATTRREQNKRDRDARNAAREQRKVDYQNSLGGFVAQAANTGRTLSALRFVGLGPAIAILVSGLGQLVAALSTLSQVLLTLPAGIAGVVSVMGTWKLATMGVSDALTALLANPFDPEAYAKSLEKLSPAAQRFATEIAKVAPYLTDLQQATQDAFFSSGLTETVQKTIDALLPQIQGMTTAIAAELSQALSSVLGQLMTEETRGDIQTFIDNLMRGLEALQPAVAPFVDAMADLVSAGSGGLVQVAELITRIVQGFNDWTNQASATGELNNLINMGVEALEMAAGWVRELVISWQQMAPVGQDILPLIDRFMKELIQALPNIIDFLAQGSVSLGLWADVLHGLNPIIGALAFAFQGLGYAIELALAPIRIGYNIMLDLLHLVGLAEGFSKIDILPGAQRELNDRAAAGAPPPPGSSAPGGLGRPQLPNVPFDQLSPADKWLYIDAQRDPTVQQMITGLPPGTRRTAKGGIVTTQPGPTSPDYTRPENLTEAAAPSEAEQRKNLEALFDPKDFIVDPWAQIGAPNVNNGLLQVAVPNGIPGLANTGVNAFGGGGLPGRGAIPPVSANSDKATIAQAIYQSAMAMGYKSDEALAFVAQAIGESQLSPGAFGATTGDATGGASGVFQFTPGTWAEFGNNKDPLDPIANIEAYMRLAQARDPRSGDIRSRLAEISKGGPAVPSNGAPWDDYLKQAQGLIGGGGATAPSIPMAGGSDSRLLDDPNNRNITRAVGNLLLQQIPGIPRIGTYRPQDPYEWHPGGRALDVNIDGDMALGDEVANWANQNKDALGINNVLWRVADHFDHVHIDFKEAVADAFDQSFGAGGDFTKGMYDAMGPSMINPATGEAGNFVVDQQALQEAGRSLQAAADRLGDANRNLAIVTEGMKTGLYDQQDLLDAQRKQTDAEGDLLKEQQDYRETERGKFDKAEPIDYSKLPFGHPAKILAGAIGGAGGSPEDIAALVGPIMGSIGAPIGQAVGDATTAAIGAVNLPARAGPASDYTKLLEQRNPLAPIAMAGFTVPDYTIAGGGPEAQNLLTNQGPPMQANGQIFSDTAALLDRSFTSLRGALEAKIDQLMSVMNEVKNLLGEEVIGPVVQNSVQSALEGGAEAIGTSLGQSAGPIIAQAVASAMPEGGANVSSGGGLVNTAFNGFNSAAGAVVNGRATGGGIEGGIPGVDSVPILAQRGEYVLDNSDVAMMGGIGGVDRWRRAMKAGRGIPRFATGGGVIGNDTVGADFFGVSQIPIIGAIVNLIIRVLLKVIGVEIEVRDTLEELTGEFRQFRGEAWEAFTATGRLMNDTSALLDRSSTSEQAAADERLRILKIVIEGIIKFVIEKLIVPIGKAVANSLINAGAGAAGGAIGASFPGGSIVGGAVSSLISTAGSAGVDIAAEIFTDFALALTSVGVDAIGQLFTGLFPDLFSGLFGGGFLAMLADPIGGIFGQLLGIPMGILSTLFGGLGGLLPFDDGGLALGTGLMPKATIAPERVLSPSTTRSLDGVLDALADGTLGGNSSSKKIEIHAPITVMGGVDAGNNVRSKLLSLIP